MKQNFIQLFAVLGMALFISCEGDDNDTVLPPASLKVVNAIIGNPSIIVNVAGDSITYSTTNSRVGFGGSLRVTVPAAEPRALEIVSASDSLDVLFDGSLELDSGASYSLFISGEAGTESDILVEDNFKQFTDSIMGVRFTNLSPNAPTIAVGLAGETSNSVDNLSFTDVSGYEEFPAKVEDGGYTFEFRDGSGTVLATSFINPLQFGAIAVKRNFTLALIGDEATGYSVARINNY